MRKLATLFAAVVFAFAVVACDGDDDPTEAPAESPAASEEASE